MGIFKQRKRLMAIRKAKKTMKYTNKACYKEIVKLNSSKENCSCPYCKTSDYVQYTGTNKGMKKFACGNPCHKNNVWFSTSTSYEAMEIYRETLAKNLCLLTHTNSSVKGIGLYNETSKYFIEYGFERLYGFILEDINSIIEIDEKADIVTIFLDISGSGLAKNKAIILARIEGKTIFEIVTASNYMSSHKIIAAVKEKLRISDKTKVVFITDGEKCFVDSIIHFFPDAIHIRQFHSKSCKGIIYVHLKYYRVRYTIRCLWDTVLHEGEPSKEVIKHRELKAKKKLAAKEQAKKNIYSELSKDVIIWKGIVYDPRGIRRIIKKKGKKEKRMDTPRKRNTSTSDADLIFKGSLEEANKVKVAAYGFKILKRIFGGLYITSNVVETIFNFKSKFYPHRTIKFGERMMVCILYNCFILRNMPKDVLVDFFRKKIITYDFIMEKVLYGSGLQRNKLEAPTFLDIIKNAFSTRRRLIIHYCDRNHKHTSRIITPLKIEPNDYDNTVQIESFCYLRNEKRTFYLEGIRDVAIYDPEAICL